MIVRIQEDENGDIILPLPDEMIEELDLHEGDEANFHLQEDNSILITFNRYKTIEIDFEKDILFELMKMAHEQNITLNELVNNILREYLDMCTDVYV